MEINTVGSAANLVREQTGSVGRMDQIAKSLDALGKQSGSAQSDTTSPWTDPGQQIPSIHQILPGLLKQLAEISDDKNPFASVLTDGSGGLPKKPTELSPLAFLNQSERKELQGLLSALLDQTSSATGSATVQKAASATGSAANSAPTQWALFSALKQVDQIVSRGEDRLHEKVSAQLTPSQEVLGHFLSDSQQNEAIALMGQKSLLEAKGEGNPLNTLEQKQLTAIDHRIGQVFASAERSLKSAGVDVALLKDTLESGKKPDVAAIIGAQKPDNPLQKDLVAIMQDQDSSNHHDIRSQNNPALKSLSAAQQVSLALMPPTGFGKAQKLFAELGQLMGQGALQSNEVEKTVALTKQTTELLQGAENTLKARGVDADQLARLLEGGQSVKTEDLEAVLGGEEGGSLDSGQQQTFAQIVARFFDNAASSTRGSETSLSSAGVMAAKRKVEYPAPLTPLEAIQKRIEMAKTEALKASAVKQAAEQREKLIAPVRDIHAEIQVSGAQPATKPVEAQQSATQLSAAGFGSVISGRSS